MSGWEEAMRGIDAIVRAAVDDGDAPGVFVGIARHTALYATDPTRLAWAHERRGGRFEVTDPADGRWSRPPTFPDGPAVCGAVVEPARTAAR